MNLFSVNDEKCKRDGICAAVCPMRLIELKDKDSVPIPVAGAEELCISCGHCVAVCPHGALSHRNMRPEQCPPVRKELLPNPEQTEHFFRNRRSVRVYKDKPVDRETLARLMDMARYAPSGHNLQPVQWMVICDGKELRKLAGLVIDWMRYMIKEQPEIAIPFHMARVVDAWEAGIDGICRSAPHLILAHAHKDDRTAPTACTIALTYLELAAAPLGLGACWGGYFNLAATLWPPMQEAIALPEGHVPLGAMMVGHPKFRHQRLPLRKEARITWR